MTLDLRDTIVAVASPPGPAPRGIVRLSGPNAWSVARARFMPARPQPSARRPWLEVGRLTVEGLPRGLPAALSWWPGPRTYTGDPLVEIHTVGSPPLLQALVASFLDLGARLATRGEFTLRAFLSGRIDLTQAEAVLGVIEADSDSQLQTALAQLAGGLASPLRSLRNRLLDIVAHLEAGLDFVEEDDVDPLARAALASELDAANQALTELLGRLQARDRPDLLPRVVLVGPPNAGKSRLFNALVGQNRAIVSPQAGTTRDYLTATIVCDGLRVELIDTAGAEAAGGWIETQAQAHREEISRAADLVLSCRSADTGAARLPNGPPRHRDVWTKADLAPAPAGFLETSAATGHGLEGLRVAIAEALRGPAQPGDAVAATAARCRDSLKRAVQALHHAAGSLAEGAGDELIALDLRQAIDELGHVLGAVFTDDILDRIFSRFCIGK